MNEKMIRMVDYERADERAFRILALYKGRTHFFEYIVSAGAGVRVDSLGGW
jgi:hypothetical protein